MLIIRTSDAPAAIGPYSQAISANGFLFASGQVPTIDTQAEQSCKNVAAILAAAGSDMTRVVKTTCFLADMADFAKFNEIYAKYFVSCPARSCVAVKALPKGVLCEIEAIAEV